MIQLLEKNITNRYPWRIHGAGIYANMTGVYWWDPWHTIYNSTMDPMGYKQFDPIEVTIRTQKWPCLMGSTSCTACSTMGGFLLINTCCRVENVKAMCLRKCWIKQLDPSEKVVSCELLTEFSAPARCDSSPHSPQQGHHHLKQILPSHRWERRQNRWFPLQQHQDIQCEWSDACHCHSPCRRHSPGAGYLRLRHFTLEPGIARCSFSQKMVR